MLNRHGEPKKKKGTIRVLVITKDDLKKEWNIPIPASWPNIIYIRCSKKGYVRWDTAKVFFLDELREYENYAVHIPCDLIE